MNPNRKPPEYGCARCARTWGSKKGFARRLVLDRPASVCPTCKTEIDASKARTA